MHLIEAVLRRGMNFLSSNLEFIAEQNLAGWSKFEVLINALIVLKGYWMTLLWMYLPIYDMHLIAIHL